MPQGQTVSVELRRAKRWAGLLLIAVSMVFVSTHFLPATWGVRCIKAMAEAAMVGALADWFA
ncbi:MAG: DUF445 domain-containing protein, partial [Comamonas sp.]